MPKENSELVEESLEEESSEGEEEEDDSVAESGTSQPAAKRGKRNGQSESEQVGPCMMYEKTAYLMYHQTQTQSPCLSFDIIPDSLGEDRSKFPQTCYFAAGTQASKTLNNRIMVLKLGNLHKMDDKDDDRSDDDSDDNDSDEEKDQTKDDKEPKLEIALISHKGCINRIRITKVNSVPLAATWSETGKVNIWDLTVPLMAVDDPEYMKKYVHNKESPRPSFIFPGHQSEGYAMDWSTTVPGRLATGDCKRNIHLWAPQDDGTWTVDRRPYLAHTDSVEDIQWSPNEENVFASCSVDKSVRVWDSRAPPLKACMLTADDAHESDVNVISWNRHEPFIVSGGDDGAVKVWDLREFAKGKPVAVFKYHSGPVTSIEWHPQDSTVFAAASGDNKLTQWDIAAESDETEDAAAGSSDAAGLPPQLLFVHQGQVDIKELHWHPQLPGTVLSTALNGFDVFRTISV